MEIENLGVNYQIHCTLQNSNPREDVERVGNGKEYFADVSTLSVARAVHYCDPSFEVKTEEPGLLPNNFQVLPCSFEVPTQDRIILGDPPLVMNPTGSFRLDAPFSFVYLFWHPERADELTTRSDSDPTSWNLEHKQTVGYKLHIMKLALEYHPLDRDLLVKPRPRGVAQCAEGESAVSTTTCTTKTPNYAVEGTVLDQNGQKKRFETDYIHANSEASVLVEGKQVRDLFVPERWLRDWSDGTIDRRWHDDHPDERPEWFDAPGEKLATRPPSWPTVRYLQEFLLGVRRFPEFGFLYYIVVFNTRPNEYRVRLYPAMKVTADEWCKIKKSPTPYRDDTNSGPPAVDSGWQKAQ